MLPAQNKGAGMNVGFPDVCLTPAGPAPVPVPYPNLGLNAQAAPFSIIVKVGMVPALNMGSQMMMTTGDEGGTAHPSIKGPGSFTTGNPIVYIEKLPGISLTCPSTGNNMNDGAGAALVPSGAPVFYSLAGEGRGAGPDPYARALDAEGAAALDRAVAAGVAEARMLEGGVGYLQLQAFSPAIASEVWAVTRALVALGMRGLLVDLAGCPGGDAAASLALASDFLPSGALLATMREIDGDEVELRSTRAGLHGWPLAIVIDERTASAAELFAGCLAAHARAVLVGRRTYGKGLGQKLGTSPGGALQAVSVADFALPNGARIEGTGLAPDIEARSHEEALSLAREAVLAMLG